MSFPLLKTPLIVIQEVLKQLELNDLFMLSLCSQNTRILVKSLRNRSLKQKYFLNCMVQAPRIGFHVDESSVKELVQIHQLSSFDKNLDGRNVAKILEIDIDGYTVPIQMGHRFFETYWQDLDQGLKTLLLYTRDILGANVETFFFTKERICLLDYINQIQEAPPTFGFITGHKDLSQDPNSEQCRHILEKCRLKTLYFEAHFPDDFVFQGNFQNFERLVLDVGHWVTVENLQALSNSCVQLEINNSKLTNENFNQFLQYWINSTVNRLKFLSIDQLNLDIVFGDFTKVLVDEPKQFISKFDTKLEFPAGHHEIQREDGTRASVGYIREMGKLCFAVWPNL